MTSHRQSMAGFYLLTYLNNKHYTIEIAVMYY